MIREPLRDILGRPAREAVDGFMERWHVPVDESPVPLVAPESLPEVLRRFYAHYGASDLELQDPPVWCRENEPGKSWVQDAPSVSVFLVQMLVMSAALSGPHGAAAAWLSPEETERVLAPLRQLDLPPWHWPGQGVRFIEPCLSDAWDSYSPRGG